MRSTHVLLCSVCVALVACGTKPMVQSDKHLQQNNVAATSAGDIPQPSKHAVILPPPKPAAKVETYTVIFSNDVSVRDVLFTLGRDANINIDIKDPSDPAMEQRITLNAINQTLPQILERLANQTDISYEFDASGNLLVKADKPFLKNYKIDFINMMRKVSSTSFTSGQIGGATSGGATQSGTTVTSDTKNDLMESLVTNIKAILADEDKIRHSARIELESSNRASSRGDGSLSVNNIAQTNQPANTGKAPAGSGKAGSGVAGAGNEDVQGQGSTTVTKNEYLPQINVNANKETGVLMVRATARQHKKIQEFVDMVMTAARRQVLIETTIAEVTLSSNYQQGIDWSRLRLGSKGFQLTQAGSAALPSASTGQMFLLDYANPTSKLGNLSASISLLDSFGDVKVLSSPKLSVMNNQTATLKVVDNRVYFTITVTPGTTTGTTITQPVYTTTPTPVAVGFTMSVTPTINDSDAVTINVHPSITRIIDYVNDPNPSLANPCGTGVTTCGVAAIVNKVPEIQTREMESIIRVNSGQIAVLGGLMQDEINNQTDAVPLLSDIPYAGNLFKNRNDIKKKTELVIFLRPVVIKDASIEGDFSEYRNNLPDAKFLKPEVEKAKQ